MLGRRVQRGDTIVEVLFAVAIFSLVAVGSMMIMSQGAATAQRSLEISLVREEINSQAEALRFLNSSYISAYRSGVTSYPAGTPAAQWKSIQAMTVAKASDFGGITTCPGTLPTNSFILNARTAQYVAPGGVMTRSTTYSQVRYNMMVIRAEGIWIEAERSPTSVEPSEANAGYIDFHIRACWDSPGQSAPVTLGTIVRLYEPRP
jgi:type II secretory pathway pseudopilin PulG